MGSESSAFIAVLIPIHSLWAFLMAHGLCCAAGLVTLHAAPASACAREGGPMGRSGDGHMGHGPQSQSPRPEACEEAAAAAAATRPDQAQEAAWLTHTAQLYCAGLSVRMLHEQVFRTMIGPRGGGAAALLVPSVRVMLDAAQAALMLSAMPLRLQQLHLHAPLPGLGPGGLALAGCMLYRMAFSDDEDSDEVRCGTVRYGGLAPAGCMQPSPLRCRCTTGCRKGLWMGQC